MRVLHLRRRHLFFFVCAALILAILWQLYGLEQNLELAFLPVSDWGVTFDKPGAQPRGNVDAKTLAQFNALFVGSAAEKVLYLTFDAGYDNGNTASILDTLKNTT